MGRSEAIWSTRVSGSVGSGCVVVHACGLTWVQARLCAGRMPTRVHLPSLTGTSAWRHDLSGRRWMMDTRREPTEPWGTSLPWDSKGDSDTTTLGNKATPTVEGDSLCEGVGGQDNFHCLWPTPPSPLLSAPGVTIVNLLGSASGVPWQEMREGGNKEAREG